MNLRLGEMAIVIASFGAWTFGAYRIGYNVRDERAVNEQFAIQKRANEQWRQLEMRYDIARTDLSEHLRKDAENAQTITKYVDRVVERPIYRSDCFDADGLRLANAALLNRAFPATPGTDSAVPRADAAGGR